MYFNDHLLPSSRLSSANMFCVPRVHTIRKSVVPPVSADGVDFNSLFVDKSGPLAKMRTLACFVLHHPAFRIAIDDPETVFAGNDNGVFVYQQEANQSLH